MAGDTAPGDGGPNRMPNEDAAAENARAAARYGGPEYKRLLDAPRRSFERTGGDLTRTVTVKTPDDSERRAIIGITGRYRPEGVSLLAVRLADLDHAVREATGQGLAQLLEHLGPPLKDRPPERQWLADGRPTAVRLGGESFL